MTTALKTKFRCNDCHELHDTEDDALDCCAPGFEERYICPLCDTDHAMAGDAFACCGFDPDGPPPPPSAAELEAHGQQRLIP